MLDMSRLGMLVGETLCLHDALAEVHPLFDKHRRILETVAGRAGLYRTRDDGHRQDGAILKRSQADEIGNATRRPVQHGIVECL